MPLLTPLFSTVPAVREAVVRPGRVAALVQATNGPIFAGEGILMGVGSFGYLAGLTSVGVAVMVLGLALSARLGVPVESTAAVAVQTGAVVPLVVAPPPPSLPPPPIFPPPEGTAEDGGVSLGVLAGAIGGGVGFLAAAALLAYLLLPGYGMKAHEVDVTDAGGIVYRDSVVPPPPPDSVSASATDMGI